MDTLLQDLKYALRGIARAPGFALAVVLTLGLGIGANTTMFGVLDVLMLRAPTHVDRPGDVARVYYGRTFGSDQFVTSTTAVPDFEALQSDGTGFATVAAFMSTELSVGRGVGARPVDARVVSAELFPLLGVEALAGRFFDRGDDQLDAPGTAVLSHGFWRSQFGGDRSVLGGTLAIGRVTYTIVGVAPRGFTGVGLEEPDVWLPLRVAGPDITERRAFTTRNWMWIQAVARVRAGVSRVDAAALATAAHRRATLGTDRPDTTTVVLLGPVQASRGPERSDNARVSLWVGGVAGIVLLVACANVANLLLARGVRRRRELAVRAGLGAGRRRLARLLLVESLALAVAGGVAALFIALWGGSLVRRFLLPGLPVDVALLDTRVLAFTGAVALLTGLLAGLAPALQSSRADVAIALRAGAGDVGLIRGRLRATLVAAQMGLALVLLVGAGLFVRSLRQVQRLDYGMDLERVLIATADFRAVGVPGPESDEAYLRLLARARRAPGVVSASATMAPYGSSVATTLRVSGHDTLPDLPGHGPYFDGVTPDYFATTGMRIVRGRGIDASDGPGAAPVAVVNEAFVRHLWPGADPIGHCLYIGDASPPCTSVVGVVADARTGGLRAPWAGVRVTYYVPFAQRLVTARLQGLVVRTRGPAREAAGTVQRVLQGSEPDLPYVAVQPLLDRVAPEWRSWRLGATMFTAFGLLALVIAALGLYGVTSYAVGQRTREIGVRIALGAQSHDVLRLVVGQGLRAAVLGLLVGGLGAVALGRGVASLLYGVKSTDPVVFGVTALMLLAVAGVAALVPARRAARVDPMEALRAE